MLSEVVLVLLTIADVEIKVSEVQPDSVSVVSLNIRSDSGFILGHSCQFQATIHECLKSWLAYGLRQDGLEGTVQKIKSWLWEVEFLSQFDRLVIVDDGKVPRQLGYLPPFLVVAVQRLSKVHFPRDFVSQVNGIAYSSVETKAATRRESMGWVAYQENVWVFSEILHLLSNDGLHSPRVDCFYVDFLSQGLFTEALLDLLEADFLSEVLETLSGRIERDLQDKLSKFQVMAYQDWNQLGWIQEVEHSSLTSLYHSLAKLFALEVDVDKVLHGVPTNHLKL